MAGFDGVDEHAAISDTVPASNTARKVFIDSPAEKKFVPAVAILDDLDDQERLRAINRFYVLNDCTFRRCSIIIHWRLYGV